MIIKRKPYHGNSGKYSGPLLPAAHCLLPFLFLCLCAFVPPANAQAGRVMVRATGQAPADLPNAREAAVEAALRQAVEVGGGVQLASETEVQNYELIKDAIYVKTAGLVEEYKVTQENPNQDGFYTVRVEAIVSRADINSKVEAWKALIKRKGRPRLMVCGAVDRVLFDRRLTAEVQGILEKRGLTVIDLDMLQENQQRAAERAAKGDLDPQKAALIVRETGADYLVTVQIEGTKYSAQEYHGVTLYPVDATAILKVIAADTARLIASEVDDGSQTGDTPERALQAVTSQVAQVALEQAIRRIAVHWLEDVDQRGGMEIQVVANAFGFERFDTLVKGLRATGGVKDIIVDQTDTQGRSQFRVVTNSPAFNLAAVLKQVDPGITIANSTKYRIEIAPGSISTMPMTMNNRTKIALGLGIGAFVLVAVGLAIVIKKGTKTESV